MITLFTLFVLFVSQAITTVHSDCSVVDLCIKSADQISCSGSPDDGYRIPSLECLPAVPDYYFNNFKEIQPHAFEKLNFLKNHSITIHLMNITTIYQDAFSARMRIPLNSKLSINITQPDDAAGLILDTHAFDGITLDRLRFFNIRSFNAQSIFESHIFGADLSINELIFEQSNLTGFYSIGTLIQPYVKNLYIRNCPSLTSLTEDGLPLFLGTAKTFEISGTNLQYIDHETFEGWEYVFKELLIKNNPKLNFLPDMVAGPFQSLTTLDLSNNSITSIDSNYDWSSYYETRHLILKYQQRLDLFIKSDLLKNVGRIRTIDFSEGIVSDNDDNLIRDHVSGMSNLASINISYTNFSDNMVIDLLTIVSNFANQTIQVSLLNHTLNDTNFCSYFQIFQNAPNLLRLELDETQDCNCIIDLFYDDEHMEMILNDTLMDPLCILNSSRSRCDIQSMLIVSQCSVGVAKPDDSNPVDIGTMAFISIMVGLTVVLVALLALGSRVIYRARRVRGMTILDMEDPMDRSSARSARGSFANSFSESIRRRFENSVSGAMIEPVENSSYEPMPESIENSSSGTMPEPVENSPYEPMPEPIENSLSGTMQEPLQDSF